MHGEKDILEMHGEKDHENDLFLAYKTVKN
jgi:hypothetical protein